MTNRNILYRVFDEAATLLYVGATLNPAQRVYTHSLDKPWWDEAAEIKMERFDTVDELLEAEKVAIIMEGPRHNVIHSKPHPGAGKPRRIKGDGTLFRRADGYWVGGIELPSTGGKRRQKRVVARSKIEVEQKLANIKDQLNIPPAVLQRDR